MFAFILLSCILLLTACLPDTSHKPGKKPNTNIDAANRIDANRIDANRIDANRIDANRIDANRIDANQQSDGQAAICNDQHFEDGLPVTWEVISNDGSSDDSGDEYFCQVTENGPTSTCGTNSLHCECVSFETCNEKVSIPIEATSYLKVSGLFSVGTGDDELVFLQINNANEANQTSLTINEEGVWLYINHREYKVAPSLPEQDWHSFSLEITLKQRSLETLFVFNTSINLEHTSDMFMAEKTQFLGPLSLGAMETTFGEIYLDEIKIETTKPLQKIKQP